MSRAESGDSKAGQTVLARLMESQIWHQLASSVGDRFTKGSMASAHLDDRHFSSFLYATGAFQAATPVLELRGSESQFVCVFFKRNCLGLQEFLPLTQSPLAFAARSCGDLSSWHWSPRLVGLVWGWDSSLTKYPSQFFIHHMWVKDQPVPYLHPSC